MAGKLILVVVIVLLLIWGVLATAQGAAPAQSSTHATKALQLTQHPQPTAKVQTVRDIKSYQNAAGVSCLQSSTCWHY